MHACSASKPASDAAMPASLRRSSSAMIASGGSALSAWLGSVVRVRARARAKARAKARVRVGAKVGVRARVRVRVASRLGQPGLGGEGLVLGREYHEVLAWPVLPRRAPFPLRPLARVGDGGGNHEHATLRVGALVEAVEVMAAPAKPGQGQGQG